MKEVITNILENKSRIVVLSPHLDDAIFSVGGLLWELKDKVEIILVNIFTRSSKPYTMSAKKFQLQCGYVSLEKLYEDRVKEDMGVYSKLNIELISLGLDDALFRKIKKPNLFRKLAGQIFPELIHIYPTYRFNIIKGKISKYDRLTEMVIEKKISEFNLTKNDYLFAPQSVGNHVDHRIVSEVSKKFLKITNLFLYADYPYNLNNNDVSKVQLTFKPNWKVKEKLISEYRSQFKAVFSKGVSKIDETYIYKL